MSPTDIPAIQQNAQEAVALGSSEGGTNFEAKHFCQGLQPIAFQHFPNTGSLPIIKPTTANSCKRASTPTFKLHDSELHLDQCIGSRIPNASKPYDEQNKWKLPEVRKPSHSSPEPEVAPAENQFITS